MPLIALTGGIASGKSTVAARFGELGAVVVDADAISRAVVEPGQPALDAVRHDQPGPGGGRAGAPARPARGRSVGPPPAPRHLLNGIVHPAVLARSQAAFRQALARDPAAVVVYDVPLIDARGVGEFDRVVVTDAPLGVRARRLVEHRGLTPADAEARIAAQMDDDERRRLATDVLDTSGSLTRTIEQADAIWEQLRAPGR